MIALCLPTWAPLDSDDFGVWTENRVGTLRYAAKRRRECRPGLLRLRQVVSGSESSRQTDFVPLVSKCQAG